MSVSEGGAEGELVLLRTAAMRARNRPLAILGLWAWEAAWGLVLAWPVASYVSAAYGTHPQGDAPLFADGGLALMDLVYGAQRSDVALVRGHLLALAPVAAVATLVPIAALLVSMAHATRARRRPSLRACLTRGAESFGALFWLLVLATFAGGLLVFLATLLGGWVTDALTARSGEARADQVGFVVGIVALLPAAFSGVLHDLARAAAVRFRVPSGRAIVLAWNTWLRSPVATLWGWAWRSALAWVPVIVATAGATRLGGRGGAALFAVLLLHQAALLTRVAVRASWLARALRAVDEAHHVLKVVPVAAISPTPPAIGTAARTDEPAAPSLDPGA